MNHHQWTESHAHLVHSLVILVTSIQHLIGQTMAHVNLMRKDELRRLCGGMIIIIIIIIIIVIIVGLLIAGRVPLTTHPLAAPQYHSQAYFNSANMLEGAASSSSVLFVLLCVWEKLQGCESTGAAHVVCDDGGRHWENVSSAK